MFIEQALEKTFDKPFGHTFSGVLAGDDPNDFLVAGGAPDPKHFNIPSLHGLANDFHGHIIRHLCFVDEIQVTFVGVWREIGEIDRLVCGLEIDSEYSIAVGGGDSKPFFAVIGCDRFIVFPSVRIRGFAGVDDHEFAFMTCGSGQAEMKPLKEIGIRILTDFQPKCIFCGIKTDKPDVAAVKIGRDLHGKGIR